MLFRRDRNGIAYLRNRARHTWPAIVGFTSGSSLGALLEAVIGPCSFALPIGFTLLALALGFSVKERVLGLPIFAGKTLPFGRPTGKKMPESSVGSSATKTSKL